MRLEILSKQTLKISAYVALLLFLSLSAYFTARNPADFGLILPDENIGSLPENETNRPIRLAETAAKPADQAASNQMRLKIPKINVDTALESVGLTLEGTVDVPKSSANAAWFNLGPRPGENGSAVITGHFGRWYNGKRSVFDYLNKLQKGDTLSVENSNGSVTDFIVRKTRLYDPSADAPEVFSAADGEPHLNLITCDGIWDAASKNYPKRLVVFTDKK